MGLPPWEHGTSGTPEDSETICFPRGRFDLHRSLTLAAALECCLQLN
jgi:hypothetical protein